MTLRADVYLDSPDLILGRTLDAVPDLAFDTEHQATADVMFVSVRRPDGASTTFEDVERAVDDDPTVANYRTSSESDDERVYAVELDVDRPLMSEVAADLGIHVLESWARPGETGWTFELEVPDRDALVALRSFWGDRGVDFELRRLFYPESPAAGDQFGLSPTQRETLLEAFERGYFEVPRRISQRELAEALDASPTAVSQRLRRGIATLVASTIAEN